MVTSGGTSLVVKSGVDIAIGVITVDSELNRGGLGVVSPKLLADEEGFAEGGNGSGNTVTFQVDVNNGILCGSPGAGNSHTISG